ncbi:MAG: hypothetical protein WCK89_24625, partial [bacterium]
MTTYQQARVLLISALIVSLPACLLAALLYVVNAILNFSGTTKTFFLGQVVPSVILASLALLMVDNFTYSVLKFGIVSSGMWRGIYSWFFAVCFGCVY